MLIESTRVRKLLNTNIESVVTQYSLEDGREAPQCPEQPDTYDFSINPIPALIILLLGIMMSSHQQSSMIATMVHSQWGNLLTGASVTRFLTYAIMFLKPPKSIYPSRPPTELLSSFGLIAGGIVFMASVSDIKSTHFCMWLTEMLLERRYYRGHDSLRPRCHVYVHCHYGHGWSLDGLGDCRPCNEGMGITKGVLSLNR